MNKIKPPKVGDVSSINEQRRDINVVLCRGCVKVGGRMALLFYLSSCIKCLKILKIFKKSKGASVSLCQLEVNKKPNSQKAVSSVDHDHLLRSTLWICGYFNTK